MNGRLREVPRLQHPRRSLGRMTMGSKIAVAVLTLWFFGIMAFGQVQTPSCRTALLIIDVQNAWAANARALTIDRVRIASKTAEIAAAARAAGIPVIIIIDASMRGQTSEWGLALVDPLEALEGDVVVEKRYQNGFVRTSLGSQLESLGVGTLLISGFASDECVRATVEGALWGGFEVIILEDGHSGGDGGRTAAEMNESWRARGLQVIASTDLEWASLCTAVEPESGQPEDE